MGRTFQRFVSRPPRRRPRPSTPCMHSQNAVQCSVFPRRSAFRESQGSRQVTSAGAYNAKTPAPVVVCCSPVRCCLNHGACAPGQFDRPRILSLSDGHFAGSSLIRSSRTTKLLGPSSARASNITTFQVNFLGGAGSHVGAGIRRFFFSQIDKRAAVYANIQRLARSPEVRQNSGGESEMATAANSASDRCNASLTA